MRIASPNRTVITLSLMIAAVLILPMSRRALAGEPSGSDLIDASLVAELDALVPGQTTMLGVVLEIEPGWYTYWRNPGDTGLPVAIEFDAAPGLTFGQPLWPAPQRKVLSGGLVDFVYTGTVALLVPVHTSEAIEADRPVRITASADWLVCKESCIPGKARLSLTIPVGRTARPGTGNPIIAEMRARLPGSAAALDEVQTSVDGNLIEIRVAGASRLTFFPAEPDQPAPVDLLGEGTASGERLAMRFEDLDGASTLDGVLSVTNGDTTRSYALRIDLSP